MLIRVPLLCCIAVSLSLTVRADEPTGQYEAGDIKVPFATADEPVVEVSLTKAAEHLELGAKAWESQRKCVSCHTDGTYLFIRPALTAVLGEPSAEVRNFFVEQLAALREQGARKIKRSGTRPAQVIYIAAGLAQWDAHITRKLSPETDQALRLMFEMQNEEGTWFSLTCWPPFESSPYQEAHMAAMAVAAAPGWLSSLAADDEVKVAVSRLTTYLRDTTPPQEYDRVLQLWTSLRLEGILTVEQQLQALAMLREKQNADGGWSIRKFAMPEQWGEGNRAERLKAEPAEIAQASDGHMTGLALLVLQEAGTAGDDAQLQRGLAWLRDNQRESGRWWTKSLNTDKWHFITFSGTAYPLLALHNAAASTEAAAK